MNYILFDTEVWDNLLPLTYTKPVSEIRIGILTIKEKWEKRLNSKCSYVTKKYLTKKYFSSKKENNNIYINSSLLPDKNLIEAILNLKKNDLLFADNIFIAGKIDMNKFDLQKIKEITLQNIITYKKSFSKINNVWDIFSKNGEEIEKDFKLLTKNRKSAEISNTNHIFGKENIFIEESAKVECSILNATNGFIYIGNEAEIMEGSIIKGSLSLCNNSTIKLGAKIYGPTTIGPHSKVGGEVNNSVISGYSNKGHDGFLGNSVLGEWCNIGADTNNSNLKNNYTNVRLWNYQAEKFTNTGLQFCGLIMGDHSKCGINTMFNTGTVVGVSSNIFGTGFPRNFIPSFSWGGASGFTEYKLNKAIETAEIVMKRRNIKLNDRDREIFKEIFELSSKYRK